MVDLGVKQSRVDMDENGEGELSPMRPVVPHVPTDVAAESFYDDLSHLGGSIHVFSPARNPLYRNAVLPRFDGAVAS